MNRAAEVSPQGIPGLISLRETQKWKRLIQKSWSPHWVMAVACSACCTAAAGDIRTNLTAIANAKARCHLDAGAPVYSCYEAGHNGFRLHRWLTEQGIVNLVVDSSSYRDQPSCASRQDPTGLTATSMLCVLHALSPTSNG